MSQSPLNAKYIITCRLNQDIAENGFGVIRGMGRFSQNPSALEATHRLKLLMLGWTFKPSVKANTDGQIETRPFITSGLLKRLMTETSEVKSHVLTETQDRIEMITPIVEQKVDQLTWTQYQRSLPFKKQLGADAEEYVYGFIVAKLRKAHPDMVLNPDLRERAPER